MLVERADALRPEPIDGQQGAKIDRGGGVELAVEADRAGLQELLDLRGHRLADARDVFQRAQAATSVDVFDGIAERENGIGCFVVGPRLERHALHVEKGRDLAQDTSYFGVLHEARLPRSFPCHEPRARG